MVATFLLSTVGLRPVYEPHNPLRLSAECAAWYRGLIEPELVADLEQIRQLTQHLAADRAVQEMCGMLIISAHAVAIDRAEGDRAIHESPQFEFFRHIRNAAAHGNRFTFIRGEPRVALALAQLVGIRLEPVGGTKLREGSKCHDSSNCLR
jgi:hypothetical protein